MTVNVPPSPGTPTTCAPAYLNGQVHTPEADTASSAAPTNVVGGWKAQPGEAHFVVECAGKGACDRTTGACMCYEGYTGSSCQRTTCPNDCSGNGVCRTLKDIAITGVSKRFVDSVAGQNIYEGMTSPYEYRLWDAEQSTSCVCDPGFGGIDCSLRQCPAGDDPLTTTPETCGGVPCADEVQSFSIDGGQGDVANEDTNPPGTYKIVFTDYTGVAYTTDEFHIYTHALTASAGVGAMETLENTAAIKDALEMLPNNVTGTVIVSQSTHYQGGPTGKDQVRFSVTFTTKSGNVPDMKIVTTGVSNAATKKSYIFQPYQPIITFEPSKPASGSVYFSVRVYPVDATLFGSAVYWQGVSTTTLTPTTTDDAFAAIVAEAFNAVPAINQELGKPFAADRNIISSDVDQTRTLAAAAGGSPAVISVRVRVAMPSKQFGANKIEYFTCSDSACATPVNSRNLQTCSGLSYLPKKICDSAAPYNCIGCAVADVSDGNKEYTVCANRGICDYTSGLCKCFRGYTGTTCGIQSTLSL
jgi:hypothetical protein